VKMRLLLVTAFFACSSAWAQNNAPASPGDQATPVADASAAVVAADAASPAPTAKVCKFAKHTCRLADQTMAPGDRCMCGDHPGTVY
jgi:hypothetical protein